MNTEKHVQKPLLQHKPSKLESQQQQQIKSKTSELSTANSRVNKTSTQVKKQSSQEDDRLKHLLKENYKRAPEKKENQQTSLKENDSKASGKSHDASSSIKSSSMNSKQSIKSNASYSRAQGIEKYTAHQLNNVLGSVTKGQPMKANQIHYMVGFLNELTQLQPAVIQYNLKSLQDQGALTSDVLFYMMRLLIKSNYRWAPTQMSVLLTTLYTLDKSKDCQSMCDPRHTLKTKVKDLNPFEIKFMQDTFNNDHNMTPQRFLYFTAFLENISNLNKKQSADYIKALKSRGVFTTKTITILMKFMESTRNHWRAIKYEKLLNILSKEEEKFKIVENKFRQRQSLLNKIPKQVVHHQDTHDFCEVMDFFIKGGPLNAQKLSSVDTFLHNLSEMDDEELFEYLVTLKRRQVINNDRCLYLKNLLQTHLVVQDAEKRQMLQKTLNRFMDQSKFQYSQHTYPSIRKYRLEMDSKRRNDSLSTVNSELEAGFSKASSFDALGNSNHVVKTYPVVTDLSQKLSESRYIFLPKMSKKTKLKLQRAYERLKVEIYLTKRLKYYQKLFRG